MKVALPDGAALGRLRAQQPPALTGDGDVLAAVGPSALDHQATVDGAMHRTPAVGVRKPAGEKRQDIGNQAVPVSAELDDGAEHILIGDPPPRHAITVAAGQARLRGNAAP